jgi:hypothetical protein
MQSPVPRGAQSISREEELEARIQALEAIVGALLRFSAGQQDLANALKEARQRGETFIQDPRNEVPPDYADFYRGSFHTLAVSMIPLKGLETFRASLQDMGTVDVRSDEEKYGTYPS